MGSLGIGTTTPAVGFKLDVNGNIQNQGFDFVLGTNDGRYIGSKTGQRALVHFDSDTLHLNYQGDFEGGVVIGSTTTINGSLNVSGNINATGTINSVSGLCVNSVCANTSTWTNIVNNGGSGGASVKAGITSINIPSTVSVPSWSGSQQVITHNLGKIPKLIKITAIQSTEGIVNPGVNDIPDGRIYFSMGIYDGVANSCIYSGGYQAYRYNSNMIGTMTGSNLSVINIVVPMTDICSASHGYTTLKIWANITAVDANSFTLSWDRGENYIYPCGTFGWPGGTIAFSWEVQ
jgi:hypothetical protein